MKAEEDWFIVDLIESRQPLLSEDVLGDGDRYVCVGAISVFALKVSWQDEVCFLFIHRAGQMHKNRALHCIRSAAKRQLKKLSIKNDF